MTDVHVASPEAAKPVQQTPIATDGPGESGEARLAFQKAIESLAKQETAKAAAEIRAGIAFVEREATHAEADIKQALEALAAELKKLADDVDKGVATNAADLEDAFVRAGRAVEDKLRASGRWTGEAVGDAIKAVGTWLSEPGKETKPDL